MTLAAIAVGVGLVALVGLVHHYALYFLGRAAPRPDFSATLAIQSTFIGLLLLHVAALSARLAQQTDVGDGNAFVGRLAHVVDG